MIEDQRSNQWNLFLFICLSVITYGDNIFASAYRPALIYYTEIIVALTLRHLLRSRIRLDHLCIICSDRTTLSLRQISTSAQTRIDLSLRQPFGFRSDSYWHNLCFSLLASTLIFQYGLIFASAFRHPLRFVLIDLCVSHSASASIQYVNASFAIE